MKIKNIVMVFVISSILASCASATIGIPTETAVPISTFTPIPPTPTITLTLDPMVNAPDGATGIDKDGNYYMEAVDGYTYFYLGATAEQEAYWARPLIENYYAYDHWDINAIPIDVWVKLGTPGSENIVKLTHRDVTNSDDKSIATDELNRPLRLKFQKNDLQELREGLISGLEFDFVFNGETMSSELGTDGGFQVTFVSESELKPLAEEHEAVRANGNLGFIYIIYDGVENGKVKVRVASSQPLDKLLGNSPAGDPQYELRKMIFLPLMSILVADEGDDLINIAAQRDAGIVASRSAFLRPKDGVPDLQIEYK